MRLLVLASCIAVMAFAGTVVNPDTLTISGISAGAAFTVQFQVAHSAKVKSAGVIAGLPWYCATGSGVSGAYECMDDPMLINIKELNDIMSLAAQYGDIDATSNIAKQGMMLFSGTIDTVVNHGSMELVQTQFQGLGLTNMVTYFNYTAEHAWITNYAGNSCTNLGSPYINNCGLDFAGEFFKFSFNHMNVSFNTERGHFNESNLMTFDQTSFGADSLSNSMDSIGYWYVPSGCRGSAMSQCHLHVNFHGCTQGQSSLGAVYVTYTGLNQWAESNNIIILYPQATTNILLENPEGCFDWWGYAGSNYANKKGTQMMIVQKMIDTIVSTGSLPPASSNKK